jgi:hypothetical protein
MTGNGQGRASWHQVLAGYSSAAARGWVPVIKQKALGTFRLDKGKKLHTVETMGDDDLEQVSRHDWGVCFGQRAPF